MKRILLIDDDPGTAQLLNVLIDTYQYDAVINYCNSTLCAFEEILRDDYDLVLLDYKMPLMNADEFLSRLYVVRKKHSYDIYILSGYNLMAVKNSLGKSNSFIKDIVPKDDIIKLFDEVLDKKESEEHKDSNVK